MLSLDLQTLKHIYDFCLEIEKTKNDTLAVIPSDCTEIATCDATCLWIWDLNVLHSA